MGYFNATISSNRRANKVLDLIFASVISNDNTKPCIRRHTPP
jgi:hypothetical protein